MLKAIKTVKTYLAKFTREFVNWRVAAITPADLENLQVGARTRA